MGRNREFDNDEVLDRAMKVFWQHGYKAASISEICHEMSLNPGSIYNAFGSKYGLFIAVVKKYFDDIAAPGIKIVEDSPCGVDGIRRYFEMITHGILNGNRRWGCLGTNAFIELSEQDSEIESVMSNHLVRLEESFRDAINRDGIDFADERAKFLICMTQGLNVIAKTKPCAASLNAMIDQALATFDAPLKA